MPQCEPSSDGTFYIVCDKDTSYLGRRSTEEDARSIMCEDCRIVDRKEYMARKAMKEVSDGDD